MKFRYLIAIVGILTLITLPAKAENLKYAFQGTLNQLDPYSLNETFTLGTLGNVYEGLVRRGKQLELEPALAESWEVCRNPPAGVSICAEVSNFTMEMTLQLKTLSFRQKGFDLRDQI